MKEVFSLDPRRRETGRPGRGKKTSSIQSRILIYYWFLSSNTRFKPILFGRLLPSILFHVFLFFFICKTCCPSRPCPLRARYCDWLVLPLQLPTPTMLFFLIRKRRSRKRNRKKMEPFRFFRHRFRRPYDSPYDTDFLFSLDYKRSYHSTYDTDSDSVAIENQP